MAQQHAAAAAAAASVLTSSALSKTQQWTAEEKQIFLTQVCVSRRLLVVDLL
jgi:hypothetical protein